MGFLRFVAAVCFLFAALGGFGWGVSWDVGTVLGLIAAGLFFYMLAVVPLAFPRTGPPAG